jgi:hypothetical protein
MQDPVKQANLKYYQIDLIEEQIELLDKYDDLLVEHRTEKYKLDLLNPPHIPVPPNQGYEINNGLLGAKRDILLKQTRNNRLTDADV